MESDLDGGVGKRLERWVSVKVRKKKGIWAVDKWV